MDFLRNHQNLHTSTIEGKKMEPYPQRGACRPSASSTGASTLASATGAAKSAWPFHSVVSLLKTHRFPGSKQLSKLLIYRMEEDLPKSTPHLSLLSLLLAFLFPGFLVGCPPWNGKRDFGQRSRFVEKQNRNVSLSAFVFLVCLLRSWKQWLCPSPCSWLTGRWQKTAPHGDLDHGNELHLITVRSSLAYQTLFSWITSQISVGPQGNVSSPPTRAECSNQELPKLNHRERNSQPDHKLPKPKHSAKRLSVLSPISKLWDSPQVSQSSVLQQNLLLLKSQLASNEKHRTNSKKYVMVSMVLDQSQQASNVRASTSTSLRAWEGHSSGK